MSILQSKPPTPDVLHDMKIFESELDSILKLKETIWMQRARST